MTIARRIAVATAALLGLVAAVLGVYAAVALGPSGAARFTTRVTGPLLIGADVVGGVDVPVTITAQGSGGGVFLGAARAQDVTDVVAGARVQRATGTTFPDRVLQVRPTGSGALPDPSGLDVWSATGTGSMQVDASAGAPAVLVVPLGTGNDQPVTVTLERRHSAWFVEALVLVVLGLLVFVGAGVWLVQQLGHRVPVGPFAPRRPRPTVARPPGVTGSPVLVPTVRRTGDEGEEER